SSSALGPFSTAARYNPRPALVARNDLVDQPVVQRLAGGHEPVVLGVELDLLGVLAGVAAEDLVQLLAKGQELLGVDLDVGGLALNAAPGLVDHDPGVRERAALALGAGRQEHGAHAGRLAHADGRDVGVHVLHHVVDAQTRVDVTTGRVHVEEDVLLGV